MKLRNRIRRSVIGLLAVCITVWSGTLLAEDEVTITAVTATYDHDSATTVFEGDVDLVSEDVKLAADRVEILTLEDGVNKITATGNPLEFLVMESDEEPASGSAKRAVVHYSTDQIDLSGDVTFMQGDVVINTQAVTYNWTTRELQTSQLDDGSKTSSDDRTTITIQVQN